MKFKFFVLFLFFARFADAAPRASFAVFPGSPGFAETTCTIPGHPTGFTFRLLADETNQYYESYMELGDGYYLVVTASAAVNARTLTVVITRIDATPYTASTNGLDLGLRLNSSVNAHCELNTGAQLTQN